MSGQRCYHCLDQIQWENDLNRNRVKEYLIFYTYEFVFHWDQIVLASHYKSDPNSHFRSDRIGKVVRQSDRITITEFETIENKYIFMTRFQLTVDKWS